jgi:predicted NUDIX family NTP pyrophosphohydrolase
VTKQSAGLLVFRAGPDRVEVLLVHPGGPFWAKKDEGAWSIPKGEVGDGEDPLVAARREFREETGFAVGDVARPLAPVRLSSGKIVHAWAVPGDAEPALLRSNTFSMEWPPRSGRSQEFPEVDRAAWFSLAEAKRKITEGQLPFLLEFERTA